MNLSNLFSSLLENKTFLIIIIKIDNFIFNKLYIIYLFILYDENYSIIQFKNNLKEDCIRGSIYTYEWNKNKIII